MTNFFTKEKFDLFAKYNVKRAKYLNSKMVILWDTERNVWKSYCCEYVLQNIFAIVNEDGSIEKGPAWVDL